MPKETIAILGLSLTVIVTVFGFGMRLGTLAERIEAQTREIELLQQDVSAINTHFILYARDQEERARTRP